MSAVLGSESPTGGVLPVTGAGPFSLTVALLGLVSIGIGAAMRRIARRRKATEMDPSSTDTAPIDPTVADEATAWLDGQLTDPIHAA